MASLAHWKRTVKDQLIHVPTVQKTLSSTVVEEHCRRAGHAWRASFWNPATTVLTFLLQVLDGAKTQRAAVNLLLTQLAAAPRRPGIDLPSPDPSAYCQARLVADSLREQVSSTTGWWGCRVWVTDGSSVSMPDTPELQGAFPQPPGQKPGCGFPVAQFVALFCWTTGAVHDVAMDSLRPHELILFRRLWHHFQAGDVVLADRAYGSYVDTARLQQRGVFGVFRLHQRRKADFRPGHVCPGRLGPEDRLVVWPRPKRWLPSFGIPVEEFERLPETLSVRLIRIASVPRGFRSRTIFMATTLLDPVQFPADEIRALYRDRWTAELNFRSLKTHLGMDVLRSQSVEMIRKEITMHLLAYNLIRLLMWEAARRHGSDLHRLSFTGTLHRLRAMGPILFLGARRGPADIGRLVELLLFWIAKDRVPDRPNRLEPRRRKRRPKGYSLLNQPRHIYHLHGDHGAR